MTACNTTCQSGIKAMILAAGLGTRLKPITDQTPKALIPVAGRPLIYYPIALLKKYGIREIAINLHHLGELIKKELGDGSQLGISITYSYEEEILGTGGGIRQLAPFFGDQAFFVINADILIDTDLGAIAAFHAKHQALATLVCRPHPILSKNSERPTALLMNQAQRITRVLLEAQSMSTDNEPFMFTGLQMINPKLLARLPSGFSCIFRGAYLPAIERGEAIYGFPHQGYWRDLGTAKHYQAVQAEFAGQGTPLSYSP